MFKRAALPASVTRTMLSPVSASSRFPAARLLTRRSLGVAAALALLSPGAAFGQSAEESGWFDAPPDAGVPDPYYAGPETSVAPEPAEVADTDQSALTTFKPALDPYGAWVTDGTYGTVWVPHAHVVGADFAPYVSSGHWALTADDDWIWVSDYPFGWAVFHYGRWVWVSGHGWAWVPGRTYANAWVVWRVPSADYAYVGWAPMPPSWVWVNGYAVTLWYAPPVPYVFCSSYYVFDYHVHHHIVHDRYLVHRIASHTRVYPTPYHAPARPSIHTAAAPGVRPAPPPSAPPRGPRISAAGIPPSSIPRERAAPPPAATRLSGARTAAPRDFSASRPTAAEVRPRAAAPERLPSEARRPVTNEPVRRSTPTPSSVPSTERTRSTPARVRVEPRSTAPARVRTPAPAPQRDFTPSTTRIRRMRHP